MKNKRNSAEVVTKKYFKKEVAKLATKEELKKEVAKLATKEELKKGLNSLEKRIDFKFDNFREEIDENAKKYRDQILTRLDGVMSELETRRDERDLETHQYSELKDQVQDHEKRIARIETSSP